MGFPDRIERTITLAHPPERVWQALTTAEGLGTWFGNKAEVDLRVGGTATLTWDSGDTATLTIERVEPHGCSRTPGPSTACLRATRAAPTWSSPWSRPAPARH